MHAFYQTPTRVMILLIIAGWLVFAATGERAVADDREAIMDLQRGASDFFPEIVPSIVQVMNMDNAAGSGYIIDREGHLITNFHVAEGSEVFEIAFYEDAGETREYREGRYRAEPLALDPALDLAVLKVDAPPEKFHPIRLGDSALMRPGDAVVTFGTPGGDPGFMVDRSWIAWQDSWLEFYNLNLGVISEVLNFEESYMFYYWMGSYDIQRAGVRDYGSAVEYLFHTDSAINHGNSGGPCVNSYGEAVGTNTWGFGGENMGFSVPSNLLKRSVAGMLEYGRVRRPWCGICLHPRRPSFSDKYQANLGADPYTGAAWFDTTPAEMKIYTINPYSPAYAAGLREGDILMRIDGRRFENIFDVYSYILGKEIGDEVIVEYERDRHGMPPARITLAEKVTRYFGTEIYGIAVGPYSYDIGRYSSDITY